MTQCFFPTEHLFFSSVLNGDSFFCYRYFKQEVSWLQSSVKIADEVPRDDISTINTVYFTAELDSLFKENQKIDPTLRWFFSLAMILINFLVTFIPALIVFIYHLLGVWYLYTKLQMMVVSQDKRCSWCLPDKAILRVKVRGLYVLSKTEADRMFLVCFI